MKMSLSPELADIREKVRKKAIEKGLLNSVEQTLSREESLMLSLADNKYEVRMALVILKNIYPKTVPLSSAIWRLERLKWVCEE